MATTQRPGTGVSQVAMLRRRLETALPGYKLELLGVEDDEGQPLWAVRDEIGHPEDVDIDPGKAVARTIEYERARASRRRNPGPSIVDGWWAR